jgi:hypothetical protein
MLKIVLIGLFAPLIMTGCKKGSGPQPSVNQAGGPSDQSPATGGQGATTTPAQPPPRQGLEGVYSISEVDRVVGNKNAVDMIPSHSEIQISFKSDGTFARVAWKQGLIALSETGTFVIEYPDQLTLLPTLVNKKNITDGRKTSYKFALSTDGDELRLWGARGNVAVFHRIKAS